MLRITISRPQTPDQIMSYEETDITIGRSTSSHLRLSEAGVSGLHARITVAGGSCVLADEGSTNGTYVNGQRIAGPTIIYPTDEVYIGTFRLTMQLTTTIAPGAVGAVGFPGQNPTGWPSADPGGLTSEPAGH